MTRSEPTTRQQIIDSAIELFMQQGVAKTSLNDIVRASGISKGGMYHHFDNRDALLVGVCDSFFSGYMEPLQDCLQQPESAEWRLRKLVALQVEGALEAMPLMQLFMDFYINAWQVEPLRDVFRQQYLALHQLLAGLIQQGMDDGCFLPDCQPQVIAAAIIALFDGVAMATGVGGDLVDYQQTVDTAAQLIIDGICVPGHG